MSSFQEKRNRLEKKTIERNAKTYLGADLHGDDSHIFVTRDGVKKMVSKEAKMKLEWEKKNHEFNTQNSVKPPAPSRPYIVKKSFDRVSIAINWRPPGKFFLFPFLFQTNNC